MFGMLGKLFDSNSREIKKLSVIVDQINQLDPKVKKLKDSDFIRKTKEFKDQL